MRALTISGILAIIVAGILNEVNETFYFHSITVIATLAGINLSLAGYYSIKQREEEE